MRRERGCTRCSGVRLSSVASSGSKYASAILWSSAREPSPYSTGAHFFFDCFSSYLHADGLVQGHGRAIALISWGRHLENRQNNSELVYVLGRACPSMVQGHRLRCFVTVSHLVDASKLGYACCFGLVCVRPTAGPQLVVARAL